MVRKHVESDRLRNAWMLNHYAASNTQAGGSRHHDLGKALVDQGWKTSIYTCSFDHVTREYLKPTAWFRPVIREIHEGVEFNWIHSTKYFNNGWRRYLNMFVFSCFLLVTSLNRRSKPDVVYGSSAHLLAPLAGWLLSKRYRSAFVVEIRDLWPDSLIQLGLNSGPIIFLLRSIEKFLYRKSDLLIGVSQGIVDGIIRNGGSVDKTMMLSHGVESSPGRSAIRNQRDQIRKEFGWDSSFVVLWAGSMEPFNGLSVVVKAAVRVAHRADFKLVLLGSGSELEALELQSAELSNVEVMGSVPRGEAFRRMVAADGGLLVSKPFDAFTGTRPRKIFDYMSASLPILCFVPGEASQIVEETEAGIVRDWATVDNVAATFELVLSNQDEFRRLGMNGVEAVTSEYSLDNTAELLSVRLDQLVKKRIAGSK